jgi:hypothetical protein
MKQNNYDDPPFFAHYSQMARSIGGLEAAGSRYLEPIAHLSNLLPDTRSI